MRNSLSTKELYEKILEMPDLHSIPRLENNILIWDLYEDAHVEAYCDSYDTYIGIISSSPSNSTHWHPDEEEMLNELYALGKKGNILVVKQYVLGTGVFYLGEPQKYRFSKKKKWHWGKLSYLEQK